jgi:hypothetical protein
MMTSMTSFRGSIPETDTPQTARRATLAAEQPSGRRPASPPLAETVLAALTGHAQVMT